MPWWNRVRQGLAYAERRSRRAHTGHRRENMLETILVEWYLAPASLWSRTMPEYCWRERSGRERSVSACWPVFVTPKAKDGCKLMGKCEARIPYAHAALYLIAPRRSLILTCS